MSYPANLRYTKEHEWVRFEAGQVVVGITHFAQSQLGDVVFIELPETGARITAGKRFSVVESVKAVSDIFAPLDGTVLKVNEALNDAPETINRDPYGDGWIAVVETTAGPDAPGLMDAAEYEGLVAKGGH